MYLRTPPHPVSSITPARQNTPTRVTFMGSPIRGSRPIFAGTLHEVQSTDLSAKIRAGEPFVPEHGQQLELLVGLGVRRRGQHQQSLGLVLGEQHLAVELDGTQLGVNEDLVVLEA